MTGAATGVGELAGSAELGVLLLSLDDDVLLVDEELLVELKLELEVGLLSLVCSPSPEAQPTSPSISAMAATAVMAWLISHLSLR